MNPSEAKKLLSQAEDDEPIPLPSSVFSELSVEDLPEGISIEVGAAKDRVIHLEWNGSLYRQGDAIFGEADHTWTRKYWYSPLGLEQYLDLVKRAVETRSRTKGDVELTHFDDDGAYIVLNFRISTAEQNLARAYAAVRKTAEEVEEVAEQAANEVGRQIAEIAARISGWGSETLDALVDTVEKAVTSNDKGRALEELCSRLFASVAGFTVTGRIRTETEEIDISVVNDSNDPRLRREAALILAECKNWTEKCGKNEFVIFQEKLRNRNGRATLGFLISWNGFTKTITKEMLRGSREDVLVVPITGLDIRRSVRDNNFNHTLIECWDRAVQT